jgi:dCMP deaminase
MKKRYLTAHMRVAYEYSTLSSCTRKKVGCILVKDDRIISIGYNGTPPGWDNCCEDENNVTKPEVYHAESNAIAKLAGSHESGKGATVFVTCAPCLDCAKLLAQMEVAEVFYSEDYRGTAGLQHLRARGIPTQQMTLQQEKQGEYICSCQHLGLIPSIQQFLQRLKWKIALHLLKSG